MALWMKVGPKNVPLQRVTNNPLLTTCCSL